LALKKQPTPHIELCQCVSDSHANSLGKAIQKEAATARTKCLSLPGNEALGPKGLAVLCEAVLSPPALVNNINLQDNPHLGDAIIGTLAPFLRHPHSQLRVVGLRNCGLTASGVELLSFGLDNSACSAMDLSFNNLHGAGSALAVACDAPLLKELKLRNCELEDEDVAPLAKELSTSSIVLLDLSANKITQIGANILAAHIGHATCLQSLDLARNSIAGHDCFGRLAGAWANVPGRVRRGKLIIAGNGNFDEEAKSFQSMLSTLAS
jgi:hypothetical protein